MTINKALLLSLTVFGLSACSPMPAKPDTTHSVGMANPASQYCVAQGGELQIKTNAEGGQAGYCHLADGQVIEEWTLFRSSQTECSAAEAEKLVGRVGLSDEQIKQSTFSKLVRRVAPHQPVTMDYSASRITVVIDPVSQKIIRASCG
ncbi:hypothetical protein EC844_12667 [Acinetobacter calcoaceticus]|uniref:Hemolysin n=1 Tax=Acinetobacter calcoaceticus TaxID=471 RepID=A0A4R1XQK0_ACICA|nr:hypothetical protein EC844_12667 [Acinetobacter calcoaceticus]